MNAVEQGIVKRVVEAGTGAEVCVSPKSMGTRAGVRIWFADLNARHGPIVEIAPHGLRGYQVVLSFGSSSREVINVIQHASEETLHLARAHVGSISKDVKLEFDGQERDDWKVTSSAFRITATLRRVAQGSEDAIASLSSDVVVPLMSALAELIGYDEVEADHVEEQGMEGAILVSLVQRRERHPRNRLLCLRLHGERCVCCNLTPGRVYGNAGGIIEVHHLEPLSNLSEPRPYNPVTDLVPLCPNCHRAVHSRRPIPLSVDELRDLMNRSAEQEST